MKLTQNYRRQRVSCYLNNIFETEWSSKWIRTDFINKYGYLMMDCRIRVQARELIEGEKLLRLLIVLLLVKFASCLGKHCHAQSVISGSYQKRRYHTTKCGSRTAVSCLGVYYYRIFSDFKVLFSHQIVPKIKGKL